MHFSHSSGKWPTVRLIVLLIFFCIGRNTYGQTASDSFHFRTPGKPVGLFTQANWDSSGQFSMLNRKIIPYQSHYNLPALLFLSESSFQPGLSQTGMNISRELMLSACRLFVDTIETEAFVKRSDSLSDLILGGDPNGPVITLSKYFNVSKCISPVEVKFERLYNPGGSLSFSENEFYRLSLSGLRYRDIYLSRNALSFFQIDHSIVEQLSVTGSQSGLFDSAELNMGKKIYGPGIAGYLPDTLPPFASFTADSCRFKSLDFTLSQAPFVNIDLVDCAIEKEFSFVDTDLDYEDMEQYGSFVRSQITPDSIKERFGSLYAEFNTSFINARMLNFREHRNLNYTFNKCRFGEDADLSDLNFDTLVIMNCTRIATDLYLKPVPYEAWISVVNSDLSRIHFDYTPNLHFIPDPAGGESKDQVNSAYTSLLAKFRTEGKVESFQRLDIEYKQWVYGQRGFWGKVINFVDRWWWYYGYRRHYIVFWSIFLFLVFASLNFWLWTRLRSIYPVIQGESTSYYDTVNRRKHRVIKSIHVMIATFFIFFSFRLEFNKINYNNTPMVIFFFVQYLIGLVCLFFIVNFILKS